MIDKFTDRLFEVAAASVLFGFTALLLAVAYHIAIVGW